jgi:hypothetical protein
VLPSLRNFFTIQKRQQISEPSVADQKLQPRPAATKASNDGRPESYRVDHDSIKVIERSTGLSDANKVRLWQPHILPSLTALEEEHRANGRSLGIIQPDPASLKFSWRDAEAEDKEDTRCTSLPL